MQPSCDLATPIQIGNGFEPLTVDTAATAHVAWALPGVSGGRSGVRYCQVPRGSVGCAPGKQAKIGIDNRRRAQHLRGPGPHLRRPGQHRRMYLQGRATRGQDSGPALPPCKVGATFLWLGAGMTKLRALSVTPILVAVLASLALAAPAGAASIWQSIPSGLGTSDTITAIDYQSDSRFWLGTGNGKIATRQAGGAFSVMASGQPTSFSDVAFKPGGAIGIAVGTNGFIFRSVDSGATWKRVNFADFDPAISCDEFSGINKNLPKVTNPAVNLLSVAWGPGNRVFVTGARSTVLRSSDDGATFTEINKSEMTDTDPRYKQLRCNTDGTVNDINPTSAAASTPNNAIPLYVYVNADIFFSNNGLTTTPNRRAANIGCGGISNFVLDPAQPSHQWSASGGRNDCLYYTLDDATFNQVVPLNRGTASVNATAHVAAGGTAQPTIISVGKGGDILQSVNGVDFYFNRAEGVLAQHDWSSDAAYDATHFAVGGAGGQLIVTSRATTIPDIVPPTGTISGPATLVAGQSGSFNANPADEAGGSGVDPASISWTATGLPPVGGNPATFSFPTAGFYTVRVTFKDLAGNPAEVDSYSVRVTDPVVPDPMPKVLIPPVVLSPTLTKSVSVAGGTVSLGVPRACVPVGSTFKATLKFKRATRKGSLFVRVSRVAFTVDGKRRTVDSRAPFVKTISVKAFKAGSRHTLKAQATIKVKRGRSPKKSISVKFTVCG